MSARAEVQIQVTDLDVALEFYESVLGLGPCTARDPHGARLELSPGTSLLLRPATASAPRPGTSGATRLGLVVSGRLEEQVQRLEQQGVHFRGPIQPDGPRRLAHFGDPDGNDLCLVELGG